MTIGSKSSWSEPQFLITERPERADANAFGGFGGYAESGDYERILGQIDFEILLDVISNLLPGYRTVLNLYLIDGYSHEESAKCYRSLPELRSRKCTAQETC